MTKQKKEQRAMSEAVLTFADLQNRESIGLIARDDLAHDQRGSLPEAIPS